MNFISIRRTIEIVYSLILIVFACWLLNIDSNAENDVSSIIKAIEQGESVINVSDGIYDFGGKSVKVNRFIIIRGESRDNTILQNITFETKYGIALENISLQGGKTYKLPTMGSKDVEGAVGVITYPVDDTAKISYSNVAFSDMCFASYIMGEGKISYDEAIGCNFFNIGRAAIYHSINSSKSVYKNNMFKNIGSRNLLWGPVAGIWIGDVTNCTYTQSDNVLIEDNTFIALNTADDNSFENHVINANFISVRANIAKINNNLINGVFGYGEDRESLYTKVKYLSVERNTIINGGYGEGYITCKGQDGIDAYANISDNIIMGEYGSGIYMYGAGTIARNHIKIDNCINGIVTYGRDCETTYSVTIEENELICNPGYFSRGKILDNIAPRSFIFSGNTQSNLEIINNKMVTENKGELWKNAINLACVSKNINVNGNYIDVGQTKCIGIMIHADESYSIANKNILINANNNNIICGDSGISIFFKNDAGVISKRKYNIKGNKINTKSLEAYAVFTSSGKNSNDTVNYKDNKVFGSKKTIWSDGSVKY